MNNPFMAAAERRSEELKGQELTSLAGGVRMSLDKSEEAAAKSSRLAEALGTQDTEFVQRNFDYLNRYAESRRLYDKLDKGSVTREMMVNGDNLDDAENLAKVEDDTSYLGIIGKKFDKGRAAANGGRALFGMMWGDETEYDAQAAQYRDAAAGQPDEGLNWFAKIPTDTAEMIGMYSGVLPDSGMAAAAAGAGGFAGGGPTAAIGAGAAGLAIGSSKEIFEIEAGWAYDEYRGLKDASGEPVSKDAARGAALLVGSINAGLEFGGLSKIPGVRSLFGLLRVAGKGGVREILRRPELAKSLAEISYSYALGGVSEGLTEAMQEITVEMGKFALKGVMPTGDEVAEVGERAWEAGQVGLRAALGLGAPATAVRTGEAVSDNRKAKQMQEVFEALGQDVNASKLRTRAPEQFQAFIRQVQERHGLVDTLYMDREAATVLFQEMVDLEALMPETFRELQEASATDGYVAIPLDEFVTHVAPSNRLAEVMQDITFDPLEPTARQQESVQAEAKTMMDEYQAQMGEIDKAEDPLYGQVYTELLAAGRRAEVAETEATLFTAGIQRLAERQGMDPLRYYREQNISIRGEVVQQEGIDVPAYTGGLLNILREGRGPQQKDVFGESLVEYLISIGGIAEPEGGELSARDLDQQMPQYGRRRLAREQGVSMEEAFEKARDAGYLGLGDFAGEEQALLDAIDREIRGEPVYSGAQLSPQMQELQSSLDALEAELDAQKIDLAALSNDEVLEQLGVREMEQAGGLRDSLASAFPSVDFSISSGPGGAIRIDKLVVPEGERGAGVGGRFMRMVTDAADAAGVPVVLTASGDFGGTKAGQQRFYKRHGFVENKGPSKDFRFQENMIREPESARTFNQNGKQARGYLIVRPSDFTLTLTRNANLSTFVHESGHLYLELMKKAALAEGVPADIVADWEVIKAYLGTDGELTTEQHETFARSFEAYLMEGKAPSQELKGVFDRFKAWMISVYRMLRNLDVELTDDIRGVFDRLLASDESIKLVQQDIVSPFDTEDSVSSPASWRRLAELRLAAIAEAEDQMLALAQTEIKRMRSDAYRERRAGLTEEIAAEIDAQPVYAVQRLLRTGNDEQIAVPAHLLGRRMSSQAITDLFADHKVSRRLVGLIARERGIHPDVLADLYGFKSGYEMVQQIIAAPARSKLIKERVQARLDEEFGNLAQDTDTVEKAAAALRNSKMQELLVAEAREMHRLLGTPERPTLNQATKEAAREHVRSLSIRSLRPHKFYMAELKAARESGEHVRAGNVQQALDAKRRQLLNHHLYREARAAVERSETIRGKLKKFESPKYMRRIRKGDPSAANAIDALLAGVELKRTPLSKVDARRQVLEHVQKAMDAGKPVHVDPALYAGAELTNWREMTLEQLEQLDSSIQALAKQGRDADKVRVEGELVDAQELIAELEAVASQNMTKEAIDRYSVDHRSPVTKLFTSYLASLRKMEFEVRFADGDVVGKWHRAIFQPFVDAQNHKESMLHESVTQLKEIMGAIDRTHAKRLGEKIDFLGTKLTRADLYVVVLNMGNQGNWDRLFSRRWKGREDAVLKRLQEELTLEDFRRIEALGQMIDTFYEPMAAVSERVDGIRPPKVEPKPLYLDRHGVTLSGWYYPVKYQDSVGTREQAVLEEANSVDMGPSPITGQVSKSMTKERMSGAGGVISLDMSGMPQHLHQVVHYITHYEAVRNFDKLRRKEAFRAMYESYFDQEGYKQLRSWLQNIAANGTLAETSHAASKTMDQIFRRARYGGSIIGLGWKVTSAGMQVLGLGPAAKELGAVRVSRWALKLAYGRTATTGQARVHPDYQLALDNSPELRFLDKQIDRDVREFTDRTIEVMKRNPIVAQGQWLLDNSYYMLIAVQKHVNAITWLAAHEKAQEEGRSVQESTQYADAVVRQTQSGGGLKDLAGLQQGNELTKLVTLFYSYFAVQHNQLRLTGRQDLLRGFWRGEGPNGRMKSLQKFAAANFWIVLVPSIVEALLRGDDEDKEDMAPFLAERIGSTYVAGLPIFRDIYRAATLDYAMPSTPLDQVVQSLVKGAESGIDVVTFQGDWNDYRNVAKAATLVTYLPFYQVQMYHEALAASDDFSDVLRNVFFGTPYSERKKLSE